MNDVTLFIEYRSGRADVSGIPRRWRERRRKKDKEEDACMDKRMVEEERKWAVDEAARGGKKVNRKRDIRE